jgi:hypothetical protein
MHFTLLLYYISIDPYICYGLCKNHHQGVQNYINSTSNVISALIVVQYISVQVPFTYKIRNIITIVLKFTYIMGKSFIKLMLFSHKFPIINTLYPALCEMLYAVHIKIFAEALELFTHTVFQLLVHTTVSLECILQGAKKMEVGLC